MSEEKCSHCSCLLDSHNVHGFCFGTDPCGPIEDRCACTNSSICWKQIESLEKKLNIAKEALKTIPPKNLNLLADYLDVVDKKLGTYQKDVQNDLRKMARLSENALREIGEDK